MQQEFPEHSSFFFYAFSTATAFLPYLLRLPCFRAFFFILPFLCFSAPFLRATP